MILCVGSCPSKKAGKGDGGHDRFQGPRRHVDDQTTDLAPTNAFELPPDRAQMPCWNERLSWRERRERLLDKSIEVPSQESAQDPPVRVHVGRPHSLQG
jgi:hypothetical protein